ncbi:Clavata3/ESR (CLE) protein [Quillaja saponaria]|uniref:Clavata3/ESR (CLE) protein n=1 Tax=Quillaja saponaria TaxID=32244 RepID=A0AAD7Q807_QUISA|nr:Clavata3/ESR (CLE) protein [Quillaja saponaria]
MIWVKSKKLKMGLLFLFLLLLLRLLELQTPCYAAAGTIGKGRVDKLRGGTSVGNSEQLKPVKSQTNIGPKDNADNDHGDKIFGAEKRKVYTGPNPLHNR